MAKKKSATKKTGRRLAADIGGTAMPPRKGAPGARFPVHAGPEQRAVAPQPLIDRYPIVVGQGLNLSYISSVFRLATTGYRQQYVDLLNELLEQDPHLFSTLQKRVISTANGRLEISPVKLPEDHEDYQLAQDCADMVQAEIARIPDLSQTIAGLLWGIYHGLSCCEIFWTRDADGWHVDRLGFVHSRRLSYPDSQSWDLYIWDQGQVYGWSSPWGSSPTNTGTFGLRVADYPGKFLVYAPQLRGDYPTREGLGRQTAVWAAFKRIGVRAAVSYLERFSKAFMDVTCSTSDDGQPREATQEDIALASQIAAAIGPGSGSDAVHPDSIQINPKSFDGGSSSKITYQDWVGICDAQMSKAVLGGTLGTDVGRGGGNRALGEVQERGEVDLEQYDATTLGEAIKRDLVMWLIRLNKPEALRVCPQVTLHVDTDPDPNALLESAGKFVDIGAPVDLDALSDSVGIALIDNTTGQPRRAYKTNLVDPTVVDPSFESDASKQAKQDAADQAAEIAKAKAAQPIVSVPGAPGAPGTPSAPPGKAPTKAPPSKDGGQPVTDQGKGAPTGKAKPGQPAPVKADTKHDDDPEGQAVLMSIRMATRDDKNAAGEVYDQFLEDYPAKCLGWVVAGHWHGPMEVELDQIDFSSRAKWRASKEPIQPYVDRITGGRMKPVIMVKTPNNPKLVIVDGHHRVLAYEQLKRPALAYVAQVHVDKGPWDEIHAMQKKGSSKSTSSRSSSRAPSYSGQGGAPGELGAKS